MLRCDRVRESLSARLDGEASELDAAVVEAHVSWCADCRRFAEEAADVNRRVRLQPVDREVVDRTPAILAAINMEDQPSRLARRPQAAARAALLVVGVIQLFHAIPALVMANGGFTGHLTRDLAAFEVALGIGLLVAVVRPARAGGLLPMVVALAGAVVAAAVSDVVAGGLPLMDEVGHLAHLGAVGLLWDLARSHDGVRPMRQRTA